MGCGLRMWYWQPSSYELAFEFEPNVHFRNMVSLCQSMSHPILSLSNVGLFYISRRYEWWSPLSMNQKAHQPYQSRGMMQVKLRQDRSKGVKLGISKQYKDCSWRWRQLNTFWCHPRDSTSWRSPRKTKWMKEGVLTQHEEQSTVHVINIQGVSSP